MEEEESSWGDEAASTLSSPSSVQVHEVTVTQAKRPAAAATVATTTACKHAKHSKSMFDEMPYQEALKLHLYGG